MAKKDFSSRVVRALDRLHVARFACGRVPNDNDGTYVHAAYDLCVKSKWPVSIIDFARFELPMNAIAEALRVGVLTVVEVKP